MMHVCLHDSFGVNYACDFDIHQMRREVARAHQETRQNNSPDNTENGKRAHILRLPPGSVVTFTNLEMDLI
jgi:hypothetical protein